jgi:glycosyltransferase involved in cell wall biosynthesis
MTRVLQLLDIDAGFQAQRGVLYLSRDTGAGFTSQVRTIGRGGDFRSGPVAFAELRRTAGEFDICHAWGMRALTAAALAGGKARIVYSPTAFPTPHTLRWLRAIMTYRDVQVISPTATLRRALVERGVPLEQCHLIRPGVEFSRIRRRRNSDLRAALGFTDADRVLLLGGESTRESAQEEAVWAASILHTLDTKYKVLFWGRGPRSAAMERFARNARQPMLLSVAQTRLGRAVEFEELLPATDVVLVTARRPAGMLEACICMAAALPIVATVWPTVSELLEDRHTALMAVSGSPRGLARRVLDLEEDPNLQWAISDMARTEAYEFFSLTRFLSQFRSVYTQLAAGGKVEVPEQAPGAGMRFHGRG